MSDELRGAAHNELGDEVLFFPRDDYAENLGCLSEIFNEVQAKLYHAHVKNTAHYNLRRKPAEFQIGDIVMKRAYVLSDKDKYFSKKLAQKFIKCRVKDKKSTLVYVLEDMSGKDLGCENVSWERFKIMSPSRKNTWTCKNCKQLALPAPTPGISTNNEGTSSLTDNVTVRSKKAVYSSPVIQKSKCITKSFSKESIHNLSLSPTNTDIVSRSYDLSTNMSLDILEELRAEIIELKSQLQITNNEMENIILENNGLRRQIIQIEKQNKILKEICTNPVPISSAKDFIQKTKKIDRRHSLYVTDDSQSLNSNTAINDKINSNISKDEHPDNIIKSRINHAQIRTDGYTIAEVFNKYYIKSESDFNNTTENTNRKIISNSLFLEPCNRNEIVSIILSLNNTKAVGYDDLSTKVVKSCARELSGAT
ncbi:hypothetical protein ACJJTC_013837 [Scirpophaga incertulas]